MKHDRTTWLLWTLIAACLLIFLIGTVSALAQEPQSAQPEKRRRAWEQRREVRPGREHISYSSDQAVDFVALEMRYRGRTVKGAPYSATVITENVQTLSDGSHITRRNTARVFRDSEGRTRREQTLNSIGPYLVTGAAPHLIFISDPVTRQDFVLDPQSQTAQKNRWRREAMRIAPQSSAEERQTQSLGTRTIEGVAAEGTRVSLTIPAGQIGNDRAIEIVTESWYASELQIVMLRKHSDPRIGEHTYRLTQLSRAEPAAELFSVPDNYKIRQGVLRHHASKARRQFEY